MKNIREYIKDNDFKMTIKNNMIDIENYIDIGNISDNEIILYISNKTIVIKGNKLKITKLLNNEILILGNYKDILFKGLNE